MRNIRSGISIASWTIVALLGINGAAQAEVFTVETRIVSYKSTNDKVAPLLQSGAGDAQAVLELAAKNLAALEKTEKPQFDVEVALQVDERAPQAFRAKSQGYTVGGNVELMRLRDGSLNVRLERVYFTCDDKSKESMTSMTTVELPCKGGPPAAVQFGGSTSTSKGRWGKTTTTAQAVFTTVRVSRDQLPPQEVVDPHSTYRRSNPGADPGFNPSADRRQLLPAR